MPKHGCLKNGTLPTYRQYMNQTRKLTDNNMNSYEIKPSESFVKANVYKQMERLKESKKEKEENAETYSSQNI